MLLLVLLPTSQTITQPKLVASSSVDNSSSIDNSLVPRLISRSGGVKPGRSSHVQYVT